MGLYLFMYMTAFSTSLWTVEGNDFALFVSLFSTIVHGN